jgi:hypothetical protein
MEPNLTQAEQSLIDKSEGTWDVEELARVELESGEEPGDQEIDTLIGPARQPIPLTAEHRKRDEEILAEVQARGHKGGRSLLSLLQELQADGCGGGSCGG